jgi:hypothetical protein
MKKSGQEEILDEAVPSYRPADCLCPAAGRAGTQVAEVNRKMGWDGSGHIKAICYDPTLITEPKTFHIQAISIILDLKNSCRPLQ